MRSTHPRKWPSMSTPPVRFTTSISVHRSSTSTAKFISNHPILPLFNKAKHHHHLDLKALHAYTITSGLISDPFAASRVIELCLRSSSPNLDYATTVFHSIACADVYTWNAMIAGHIAHSSPESCVAYYFLMRRSLAPPNNYTFALLIKACTLAGVAIGVAREAHGQVFKCGAEDWLVVKNSLLSMYCNLGLLDDAYELFKKSFDLDVVSWNTMISAFGKNGDFRSARKAFDEMPERSLVSWSAVIDGYVRSGDACEALRLFRRMQEERMKPDSVVLVSVLKACAQLGALAQGRWIHAYIDRNELCEDGNVILWTALVDMYCKCGCIDVARQVFDCIRDVRDVVLWNSMIGGLAMNGCGADALELFRRMKEQELRPNETTFIEVLCACAHNGLVEEGIEIFESMKSYGCEPQREHYGCLVDVLARSGRLREAEQVLVNMPMEPQASQWGALMSACRTHNNIDVGERAGRRSIMLEPHDGGRYVLLANMYANVGRWKEASNTRRAMEAKGVNKEMGCSFIEWEGIVHEFKVGDMRHDQTRQIYAMLEEMERKLEMIGYVKDASQLVVDVSDKEEKGMALAYHSERLAIAFGMINMANGLPIRIVKNLRVCRDCHEYTKLVSKVYQRELIVRDRNRFHRFVDGQCSCKDFW
ncbi:putative tetratricopeptide-like helical domain superfamily, DYW domain-containing protein [Dioscorea sansibarensis]